MKSIHWLMVLPFVGMLGGIPFVNKVEPYVFGMPFLLFWLVGWVIATSVIMTIVYRFDPAVKEDEQT